MVTAELAPFLLRRQPFVLETRVPPAAPPAAHLRARQALAQQSFVVSEGGNLWTCRFEELPEQGVYRAHMTPPMTATQKRAHEAGRALGQLAGGVLLGALATILYKELPGVFRPERG